MANTDVYVNKITLPKDRSNTYTGILVDTASQKPWYGTSATTASSQIKVVSCTGFYLQTGAIISIAFTEANTYSDGILYLNVNSTGSKAVYLNGAQTAAHQDNLLWEANSTLTFVYDGAYFRFISKGVNGGSVWYGSSITTASTQAKTVEIPDYFLEKGSLVVIHFSTANTYSSAKITLDVNSTGAKDIYYNGSVTSSSNKLLWEANTTITFVYNGTGYVYVTSSKGGTVTDVQIGGTSILSSGVANIVTNSTYNSSSNKIATMSDIPSVTSTYSSTGTTAVNGTAVNAALQTLDSSITATTGQAISAITITDGKITGSSKVSVGEANLVTDVQINGTSILSSKVANLVTNSAYNSSSNKIATMSDISDTKVKLTSVNSSSEYPLVLGPSSISSGTAYEGNYVSSITVNASSRQLTLQAIKLDYDSNCYATININGYGGTATNNTPNITFYSLKGNYGDTSNHNVYLKGIATPSSDYDAANKKYVDDAVGAISDTKVTNTLATTTKYYVTGTTSSTTNTGTQSFDSGIYATTTAGQLNATTYLVNEKTRLEYNSTTNSLDFIFI